MSLKTKDVVSDSTKFRLEQVWNGDSSIATWTATGGNRPQTGGSAREYPLMFDGNTGTMWHGFDPPSVQNAVTITFINPVPFVSLKVSVL